MVGSRALMTTSHLKGLEEFFPGTNDIIQEGEQAGTYLILAFYARLSYALKNPEVAGIWMYS